MKIQLICKYNLCERTFEVAYKKRYQEYCSRQCRARATGAGTYLRQLQLKSDIAHNAEISAGHRMVMLDCWYGEQGNVL